MLLESQILTRNRSTGLNYSSRMMMALERSQEMMHHIIRHLSVLIRKAVRKCTPSQTREFMFSSAAWEKLKELLSAEHLQSVRLVIQTDKQSKQNKRNSHENQTSNLPRHRGARCHATRAPADAVTDWNDIAVPALVAAVPPRPGPVGFLDMAIVQAAVYDAVTAIDRRFQPYHVEISGASGSPEAAVAKAAHDVLVNIFASQAAALDAKYHDYLLNNSLAENDPGVAVGEVAAAAIIALRANDGRVPNPLPPPFTGGTRPSEWRPTPSFQAGPPPSFSPMATPWLGAVPTFTLRSGDQYRPKPPPPLNSKRYAKAYNEVKALGSLVGSTRTPEQTDLAYFYAVINPVFILRVLRDIADAHVDNIGDHARLLALATLAIADSAITAWDSKRYFDFWRPLTAIQEGNNDGNPATLGDPAWQPFLNTPPYPDYTSKRGRG